LTDDAPLIEGCVSWVEEGPVGEGLVGSIEQNKTIKWCKQRRSKSIYIKNETNADKAVAHFGH
jgi:hypothetical protein